MILFFMSVLCCLKVGWVSKIWGVMFLVVPPMEKFSMLFVMLWFSIYSFDLLSVMCCYSIICCKPKHGKNSIFEFCWYNECLTLNVGCIFWKLHSKLNGSYDVVGSDYKYIHYDIIDFFGYMTISLTIGSNFVTIFSSIECWVFCKDFYILSLLVLL